MCAVLAFTAPARCCPTPQLITRDYAQLGVLFNRYGWCATVGLRTPCVLRLLRCTPMAVELDLAVGKPMAVLEHAGVGARAA